MIIVPIKVGIGVRYLFENVHPVTGRRTPLSGWSPNIMLTSGMNIMADRGDWINYIQVGESNITPDASQTSLQAWVAGTNNKVAGSSVTGAQPNPGPYYGSQQDTFRFNPGEIPTSNPLNEVGLGWGDGSGGADDIISRARIVDINGDFTSPTPDPTEFLDVTRQVRYVPPTGDVPGTVTFNTVDYDYILRAANVTSTQSWASRIGQAMGQVSNSNADWKAFDGDIGTVDQEPGGLSADCDNSDQFNYAYVNLSNTIGMGCNCGAGSGTGNAWNLAGGLRSLRIRTTAGDYQIQFDQHPSPSGIGVPKSDANTMFVKFNMTWANGPIT